MLYKRIRDRGLAREMVLRALLLTFIDALRSEEYIVRAPRGPSVAAPRLARKKTA